MTSPIIDGLRVHPLLVPMEVPHRTASGEISASPLVLLDLFTDCGIVGHALIFTYTPAALQPTAQLIKNIEPLIKGQLLDPAAIAASLSARFRLLGTQGLVGMALAGIDMACWDAQARHQSLPLYRLLGGRQATIPAYGAVGFDGEVGSANAAESWAKQGFKGIKAKIGYPTVAEDVAVIRAMRKASGSGMAIMVDYNQSLSPTKAMERLRVLDGEGLTWVEEPTLTTDYRGMAAVARQSGIPIQCGENWWGTADMQLAIDASASNYVMPDVMKIGGVTGWLAAVQLATKNELPMSSHLWPELSARLLCCTPTAHWLEYMDWWSPVLKEPLQVIDGVAVVDEQLGSGLEWRQSTIEAYSV
ncbi:MAG: enolase C-terminal domain-like protein [Granulosicoccus sp.]